MEARLRQLERTSPWLFARLVSLAVLDNSGYGSDESLVKIVQEVAPALDNDLSLKIGRVVTQWAVANMVWEGLR